MQRFLKERIRPPSLVVYHSDDLGSRVMTCRTAFGVVFMSCNRKPAADSYSPLWFMNSKSKWVTTSYISITRPKYLVHPTVPEFWHLSLHVCKFNTFGAAPAITPFRYSFDARIFPRSRFLDKLGLKSKDCPLQILAAAEDR